MKNKLFMRVMGIALAVATMAASMPLTASANEIPETETTAEVTPADTNTSSTEDFNIDWKSMSDEEITQAVLESYNEEGVAYWLADMSYSDYQEIIKRNTILASDCNVMTYELNDYNESTDCYDTVNCSEQTVPFYEHLFTDYNLDAPAPASKIPMERVVFGAKTGQYYYYYKSNNTTTGYDTLSISGLDPTTSITSSTTNSNGQTATIKVTRTGYITGGAMNWSSNTFTQALHSPNYLTGVSTDSKTNIALVSTSTLVKNVGYAVNITTQDMSSGMCAVRQGSSFKNGTAFSGDVNYANASTYTIQTATSVTENTTVGKSTSAGGTITNGSAGKYVFNFIPATYTVSYAGGTGHPEGDTSSQTASYGSTYKTAACGFTNSFKVSFNMGSDENGEVTDVSKDTESVARAFAGWSCAGKTYSANQDYTNLTAANGATVTMTALWANASYTIPNLERTGYTLLNWVDANDNKIKYNVGDDISLTSDMTLTAQWEKNDVIVKVNHYIQTAPGSGYTLNKSENITVAESVDYTFELDQDSIDKVNAIAGCHCVKPTVITRATTQSSNTAINYYYDCVADSAGSVTNNYINNYGLSSAQVEEIIAAINKNGNATLTINGTKFTIVRNPDGTFSIKFVSTTTPDITIPSFIKFGDTVYNITNISDGAFKNNGTIKNVIISNGITTIGDYAFYNCKKLETVTMPNTILKIGKYAFAKCSKLKKVTMSANCYEWGEGIFSDDKALSSISLGRKLAKVPSKAFRNCTKLKSITIPTSVTTIGKQAFYKCKNLKSVKIKTKVLKSVGSSAFKGCKKNLRITVPKNKGTVYSNLLKGKY